VCILLAIVLIAGKHVESSLLLYRFKTEYNLTACADIGASITHSGTIAKYISLFIRLASI
jgi:hypothetical protein